MTKFNYSGPFKNEIIDYLKFRESKQQKLHPVDLYLYHFDKYTIENKCNNILTKELIENWLILKDTESRNTLRLRAYTLKSFAKYLNLRDHNAYVLDSKIYNCKTNYIPHIFTDKEISKFFKQIDVTIKNKKQIPNKVQQIKLFFKILYCCGLRDSELLNLKFKNINLEDKCILIENSKNDIDRLVFINDDLADNLNTYINKYSNGFNEYVFYNSKTQNRLSMYTFSQAFKTILKEASFDCNIRYRIHDFRHTFAVKNIKTAYENSEDIYSMLPILMNYMGHSDISSTEYYLRFTPDLYEKVTKQFENNFGDVLPRMKSDFYNE